MTKLINQYLQNQQKIERTEEKGPLEIVIAPLTGGMIGCIFSIVLSFIIGEISPIFVAGTTAIGVLNGITFSFETKYTADKLHIPEREAGILILTSESFISTTIILQVLSDIFFYSAHNSLRCHDSNQDIYPIGLNLVMYGVAGLITLGDHTINTSEN